MLSKWEDICVLENPEQLPVYITRDVNGNVSDHIVMAKKKISTEQSENSPRRRQNQQSVKKNKKFPYFFVEKNHQKRSFQSKFKNKIQKAISETKHTVLTDKIRRVHKNQISNPITVQDTEKQTLKFQSSRRRANAATSVSPKRRPTSSSNNNTGTPSKWIQKRDEYGQFIGDWVETEPKTQTSTPERTPQGNEMMSPGLFLNTTEEGEINRTEDSEAGNIKQENICNTETNTSNTDVNLSPENSRPVRNRTRPK